MKEKDKKIYNVFFDTTSHDSSSMEHLGTVATLGEAEILIGSDIAAGRRSQNRDQERPRHDYYLGRRADLPADGREYVVEAVEITIGGGGSMKDEELDEIATRVDALGAKVGKLASGERPIVVAFALSKIVVESIYHDGGSYEDAENVLRTIWEKVIEAHRTGACRAH